MSSEATLDEIIELFPPEVICDFSCLKLQLLYVTLREVLIFCGIQVDGRRGLYIPQAIVNVVCQPDNLMRNTDSSLIADFKLSAGKISGTSSITPTEEAIAKASDSESFWRRADNTSKRFSDNEKYSAILAESPNLNEVRKAYITYCNQKEFPRPD